MKKNIKKAGNKKGRNVKEKANVVNVNAAGIDIGSKEHYVAVPPDRDGQPVRVFKCYTPDLHLMAKWLKECRIETVAMESTGVYWIPAWQILEQYGLEVKLVNAHHVKNVPGRKSDVQDCQWLQKLHSWGLLSGGFLPEKEIVVLRGYWRHRAELIESCSKQILLMQKALTLMNLQLHKVLTDITGMTGMAIIRAIVNGERDPMALAQMRHQQVKSSHDEIAAALTGDYREEHLLSLRHALELYDVYQAKIRECDGHVERYLSSFEDKGEVTVEREQPRIGRERKRRNNEPYFDLRGELHRIAGVDLTQIDGINTLTAQTIISECGLDMSRFPTEKHFASWLGLCPNNRITGGKVTKSRTRKVKNRAAKALRLAAQSLHRSLSALGAYYRRMRGRLGAPQAITAAAHKLARLVYRLLKHGPEYVDKGRNYYEEQYNQRVLKNVKNRAQSMGFILVNVQTGEAVS
jgi:transposase